MLETHSKIPLIQKFNMALQMKWLNCQKSLTNGSKLKMGPMDCNSKNTAKRNMSSTVQGCKNVAIFLTPETTP